MSIGKWVTLALWPVCAAGFIVGVDSTLAWVGRAVFWILLVAHAAECLVFLPRLRDAGGSLPGHIGQTMLFGVLHIRELPKQSDPA